MEEVSKIFTPEVSNVLIQLKELYQEANDRAAMKVAEFLQHNQPELKEFIDEHILTCVESYRK